MGETVRACRYCDRSFEEERRYLRHLARAHERGELGRVDRRRVESAFGGLQTWWTDLLAERLAESALARGAAYVATLDSPVPRRSLLTQAVLAAVLVVAVAALLAAAGP